MLAQLVAFLAVSAVVICTPGPDTALTVRNVFSGGRSSGVWTAAGVAIGQSIWTVAASLGIAGLIVASEPAFLVVKIIGVAYLVWLGAQSLWAAWHGYGHEYRADARPLRHPSAARSLRQGIINDLANPKMAAFFMSLLPQFAPEGRGALPVMLLLGLLFCLFTFSWLVLYSVAVAKLRAVLNRSRVRRAIDTLAGCVLIAFGARLALSQR